MPNLESAPAVCQVSDLSSLRLDEALNMVGKTIAGIKAGEYSLQVRFTDGSLLDVTGQTYGDCALAVELTEPLAS